MPNCSRPQTIAIAKRDLQWETVFQNVNENHRVVLMCLGDRSHDTSALATSSFLSYNTVSNSLSRLRGWGLIEKKPKSKGAYRIVHPDFATYCMKRRKTSKLAVESKMWERIETTSDTIFSSIVLPMIDNHLCSLSKEQARIEFQRQYNKIFENLQKK